jgi:amino acid transporter
MLDAGPARAGALTTGRVVFLVIAAAAPLAAMVGNLPLAFVYGNGAGLPVAFAIAGAIFVCFSVGYAAISRRVVSAGAFYSYVAAGIGRSPAVGAAYLAALSYIALSIGMTGVFGYFVHEVLATLGVEVFWLWPSAAALLLVATLGYRSVALSARIVGVLVLAELAVLTVVDAGILVHHGRAALPVESLSPRYAFGGSIGVGLTFAVTTFIGFECAALYSEETIDPRRSVPRATYIALSVLGPIYLATSWFTVGAIGLAHAKEVAGRDLGTLMIDIAAANATHTTGDILAVLLCTSLLAAALAFHNVGSRYLFALGRERVLPAALGRYHARHLSPHVASLTVAVLSAVVVGAFAFAGLNPYLTLSTSMIGMSTLGVLLLEVITGLSVVTFFLQRREGSYLRTVVVPAMGTAGLALALTLAIKHFPTLVGTHNRIIANLPWLLAVVPMVGLFAGLHASRRDWSSARPRPVVPNRHDVVTHRAR